VALKQCAVGRPNTLILLHSRREPFSLRSHAMAPVTFRKSWLHTRVAGLGVAAYRSKVPVACSETRFPMPALVTPAQQDPSLQRA